MQLTEPRNTRNTRKEIQAGTVWEPGSPSLSSGHCSVTARRQPAGESSPLFSCVSCISWFTQLHRYGLGQDDFIWEWFCQNGPACPLCGFCAFSWPIEAALEPVWKIDWDVAQLVRSSAFRRCPSRFKIRLHARDQIGRAHV